MAGKQTNKKFINRQPSSETNKSEAISWWRTKYKHPTESLLSQSSRQTSSGVAESGSWRIMPLRGAEKKGEQTN
jgi:hypothetical protein